MDRPYGAVIGVLQTILQMLENGDRVKGFSSRGPTYIGVATDHVIESFRNRLWPDYKTGAGIEPALLAQFHPLEEALAAMGVVVWPMIELEADDALASAAHLASKDKKVKKVAIWTPDKDLAQCVRGMRVVQIEAGAKRFAMRLGSAKSSASAHSSSRICSHSSAMRPTGTRHRWNRRKNRRPAFEPYGPIENFPSNVLGEQLDLALLFKNLATLRTDAPLFKKVETLRWRGATPEFAAWAIGWNRRGCSSVAKGLRLESRQVESDCDADRRLMTAGQGGRVIKFDPPRIWGPCLRATTPVRRRSIETDDSGRI